MCITRDLRLHGIRRVHFHIKRKSAKMENYKFKWAARGPGHHHPHFNAGEKLGRAQARLKARVR